MKDEEYANLQRILDEFNEEIKSWTKEQAMDYLVKLGTHNLDGTLTKEYDENT